MRQVERAGSGTRRTTTAEDLTTITVSLWMVLGLLVDAYKHSTDPQLETFWTPWHALFYSGFLATAAWLIVIVWRRQIPGRSFLDWAPPGHRAALYGIGIFAAGGVGDAIWHSVLGVETSLDALLSPTHLLLFVGMLLIVTAPFRAAWLDSGTGRAASFKSFLPVLASITFATALVAFFFEYAWIVVQDWPPRRPYVPETGRGEFEAAFGFLGVIVTTAVSVAPVLVMTRRWVAPFGSVTVLFVFVNLFIAIAFDHDLIGLIPALVAGAAGDIMVRRHVAGRLVSALVPAALWGTYFVAVGRLDPGLGWPPEVWGGSIVFACLAGIGIQLLIETGAVPVDADPRRPEYLGA